MLVLVGHYVLHWLSGMTEKDILASGMVCQESRDIVYLALVRDPAAGGRRVVFEVLRGVNPDPFRHDEERE